jgi:hypothetical protein
VVKLVCCLLLCRVVVVRCKSIPSTYHVRLLIHLGTVPESALHLIPDTPGTHEAVIIRRFPVDVLAEQPMQSPRALASRGHALVNWCLGWPGKAVHTRESGGRSVSSV